MSQDQRVRVAMIGASKRAAYMYAPLLKGLSKDVEVVAVWNRSEEPARRLGGLIGVPWYTDMSRLMRETSPSIGVVAVTHASNGEVGLKAVEHGMNVLLETPIAPTLGEADAIIAAARRQNLKIEVAEQFHRRPLEQAKLALIKSGVFGRVYTSFNDFCGHGYHGISIMRSFLGFDVKPLRVTGMARSYDLAPHWSQVSATNGPRKETQEHGLFEFEGGRLGVFHWTNVGYDSSLRWWRSSRFLAEKGMGISVGFGLDLEEKLSILTPDGEGPQFLSLERVWERCDGGALTAIRVHTGRAGEPVIEWKNPFCTGEKGQNPQWHDDEIGVAGCILSLVNAVRSGGEPTYGPLQARLDQELILALRRSSEQGGRPVELPLAPG
jgi:predicted dehydrogenase